MKPFVLSDIKDYQKDGECKGHKKNAVHSCLGELIANADLDKL